MGRTGRGPAARHLSVPSGQTGTSPSPPAQGHRVHLVGSCGNQRGPLTCLRLHSRQADEVPAVGWAAPGRRDTGGETGPAVCPSGERFAFSAPCVPSPLPEHDQSCCLRSDCVTARGPQPQTGSAPALRVPGPHPAVRGICLEPSSPGTCPARGCGNGPQVLTLPGCRRASPRALPPRARRAREHTSLIPASSVTGSAPPPTLPGVMHGCWGAPLPRAHPAPCTALDASPRCFSTSAAAPKRSAVAPSTRPRSSSGDTGGGGAVRAGQGPRGGSGGVVAGRRAAPEPYSPCHSSPR